MVVRRGGGECRFLLLRAYRYWDFPKGLLEPGEEPFDAACREVREETGITDLRFRWGPVHTDTPAYAHGKVARYYVAETGEDAVELPVSPELGRPEHEEYRWATRAEARALVVTRIAAVLEWAAALAGCAGGPGQSGLREGGSAGGVESG